MAIIITDWALQSYLKLKGKNMFTDSEYHTILRPDTLNLLTFPNPNTFFGANSNNWGPANKGAGVNVRSGYKLKWIVGPGRNVLRVCVVSHGGDWYLCQGYVKTKPQHDYMNSLLLESYKTDIQQNKFGNRGILT